MKEVVAKISSYNIFNNLLPGIIFIEIGKDFIPLHYQEKDIFYNFFICYFVGMTISRASSVLVEPLLRKSKFVKYVPYKDFCEALNVDSKIEVLVETSNTFRSLFTMVLILLFLKGICKINGSYFKLAETTLQMMGMCFLAVLYLFSLRKQTNFITARVKKKY